MTTEVEYFPGQKSRVLDIAYGIIEHSGEHYGQLVVYYRLEGLVRRSRGPRSKAQQARYPVLYRAPLARMGGDFGFLTFRIQCAAQP